MPDELKEASDLSEEDLPSPTEHARQIAADLETYATALRNASGERGNRPS